MWEIGNEKHASWYLKDVRVELESYKSNKYKR